ncbi:MAG: lipopolysaccharide heptosyltransferase II [Bdellovibrionia bacterium]
MDWSQAKEILCIRLDSLGDVLMTGPAIRALKSQVRGRRITLLTSRSGAEAAKLMPEIDRVLVYDAPWLKATRPRESAEPEFGWIEKLKGYEFDGAVIFTVYSQNPLPSAMLCYLAEIPLRLAYCRENPYQLLTHWVKETEPQDQIRHEVKRQLDLVVTVSPGSSPGVFDDRMAVQVSEESGDRVLKNLIELGIDVMAPWAVMHPGATAPSRRYPPKKFAEAARTLIEEHGYEIVLTGSKDETSLVEELLKELPNHRQRVHSLVGLLSLEDLAALLTLAPVLISNNTGTVHLAAACETPVVDLYALTNPQHTPWKVRNRVLFQDVECRYCYKSVCPEGHNACLTGVASAEVVRATLELQNERISDVHAWNQCRLP